MLYMKKREFTLKQNEERQIVIDEPGEYVVELVGRGARAEILGALVARGKDQIAVDVTTIHRAQNTSAKTLIRAVASDHAKVVLTGLIKIEKGAQKTDAFLTENVLLLSDDAKADAIPKLEIEADDVRASHAATVGQIDEEQLFYLMSRGISSAQAEEMIVDGFLGAVREKIKK